MKISEPVSLTWHPNGHLLVVGSHHTWQINPQTPIVTPTASPNCTTPATSSSEISADQRLLVLGEKGIEVVHTPMENSFGCQ